MRRLSFDQINGPGDSHASKTYNGNGTADKDSGPIVYPSTDFLIHEKADILTPRTIPITGIDMNTAANPPIIGTGPDSIWATVNISAEASSNEPFNLGWPAPLDVVIILDIVYVLSFQQCSESISNRTRPHIHISMLRQIVTSSLAIVSSLTAVDDRFAIVYVDKDSAHGFGLLLSLGVHSLDSARIAMDGFSLHQLTGQRSRKIELQKIIQQISETVYLRDRPALCHTFFVTASPSVRLSTPATDKEIGFHTISPHFRFPFSGSNIPSGWHIFYDTNSYDANSKEAVLRHKISTAIEHMRTGVEPGVVTDLKLSLVAGDRCQVQAVLEECHLDLLRPGEKWIVPVQIRVPTASIRRPLQVTDGNTTCRNSHPTVEKVMTQLQDLLTDLSHEDITQHIMSARLEYRHTLLSAHNIVQLESSCMVVRDAHEFGIASLEP